MNIAHEGSPIIALLGLGVRHGDRIAAQLIGQAPKLGGCHRLNPRYIFPRFQGSVQIGLAPGSNRVPFTMNSGSNRDRLRRYRAARRHSRIASRCSAPRPATSA